MRCEWLSLEGVACLGALLTLFRSSLPTDITSKVLLRMHREEQEDSDRKMGALSEAVAPIVRGEVLL